MDKHWYQYEDTGELGHDWSVQKWSLELAVLGLESVLNRTHGEVEVCLEQSGDQSQSLVGELSILGCSDAGPHDKGSAEDGPNLYELKMVSDARRTAAMEVNELR